MEDSKHSFLKDAPLGKKSAYIDTYSPELLYVIPRQNTRDLLNVKALPFTGADLWVGYEFSWLDLRKKPHVGIIKFSVPAESFYLLESKSVKLYLNSFQNTVFESIVQICSVIEKDLLKAVGTPTIVEITPLDEVPHQLTVWTGTCLDALEIDCNSLHHPNPALLKTSTEWKHETVYTHLLKSNCLVTGQPDWGSLQIEYQGGAIDHGALLQYIVSYRNHQGFHEQCIESIFLDIYQICQPKELTVYGRYTRRGGIEINPYRTNNPKFKADHCRLIRQ
jgi:7-cyano-7-deazaguanine reductase